MIVPFRTEGTPGPTWRTRLGTPEARRTVTAYAFLAPSLVILALFSFWPIINSLYLSFTDTSGFGETNWIGWANYQRMIQDPAFWNALINTLYYSAMTVPTSIAFALVLALLLNRRLLARGFFRAVIFLPFVISLSIISIAWAFMLDPNIGFIIGWLNAFGLDTGNGVRDPNLAMPAVAMVGIWRNVGYFMVMYLAGLQSIPRDLYDAAALDNATPFQRFTGITWPMLANTTMFVCVIAAIFSFQVFDQIYVMTAGGPFFVTETMLLQIYRVGISQLRIGYASAISWALVVIVFSLSLLQIWYFNKRAIRA